MRGFPRGSPRAIRDPTASSSGRASSPRRRGGADQPDGIRFVAPGVSADPDSVRAGHPFPRLRPHGSRRHNRAEGQDGLLLPLRDRRHDNAGRRTKTAPDRRRRPVRRDGACQDFIGRYYHSWQAFWTRRRSRSRFRPYGSATTSTSSVNDPRFQIADARTARSSCPTDRHVAQAHERVAHRRGNARGLPHALKAYRPDQSSARSTASTRSSSRGTTDEFADDCWQDHSTSFNELKSVTKRFTTSRTRRGATAANRAFSEYQPIDITYEANPTFPNDIRSIASSSTASTSTSS